MGYDTGKLQVFLRLERHGGPEDEADNRAADDLKMEIEALVASTPEYKRIVSDIWGR